MGKNYAVEKDLKEVWNRLADNTYTSEDIAFILESKDDNALFLQFAEVWERVRMETEANTPPLTQEQEEAYRRKVAQIISESERFTGVRLVEKSSRKTGRIRKIIYAAAAAVLLGFLIPSTYYYMKHKTEQANVQYLEEATQRGQIRTVVLPDSTHVTLNADSRIIYPERFTGNERTVEIHGEALFEVTSDPKRPFTVKNESMNIRVLGTVFDVKAYPDDMLATVSVVSGKVKVDFAEGKALLETNQQVRINKTTGNFEKTDIDAQKYLLWKDGTLYFQRTPLREVINMLNRHYPQVEIELTEGDYPNLISGEHDNKRVEAVLSSVVYSTALTCEKQGTKYVIYQKK